MHTTDSLAEQSRLAAALADPARYGPGCTRVVHLQTHISDVFLTGRYAFKIKKPLDLGFLDFTTLARRRFCCDEEVRLNRRLAPEIYLDVVPITGSVDAPVVNGDGAAIEYAVRMREFPQEALASRMLSRGELAPAHIDTLAMTVAAFHDRVEIAPPASAFGSPAAVLRVAEDNFTHIGHVRTADAERAALTPLLAWTRSEHASRQDAFLHRHDNGFVRECHGDLHLGNIAVLDGAVTVFDCIEFNPELRWIDVMSEVAFAVMDLEDRGRPDFGHRFLNGYLEHTGDYAGLAVLRFYLAYRAMVRAKVACLRGSQVAAGEVREACDAEFRSYVALAARYAQPPQPAWIVTHGLSGCGKTTLTQRLLELCGAVRIRTDVERKRLHGLAAAARSGSALDEGLYASGATERTYQRALAMAAEVAAAGRVAIIDGAFLKRWQRDLARERAAALGIPCVIVDFAASVPTLRARVAERSARGNDASEADVAVLEQQLRTQDPIAADEHGITSRYNAEAPLEHAADPVAWQEVFDRLGLPAPERT